MVHSLYRYRSKKLFIVFLLYFRITSGPWDPEIVKSDLGIEDERIKVT